jgi:Family of unknown function (DUF5995)
LSAPNDGDLLSIVRGTPNSVADVIGMLRSIDALLPDSDGVKWFNWLYLQVTEAVNAKVGQGGLNDAAWLAELDVRFASLYFNALQGSLSPEGPRAPGCWAAMFRRRNDVMLARIQFAIAGINAHINHDLALAIVSTCDSSGIAPSHQSSQYRDFTALNADLDSVIDSAKRTLHVRLLGDALPDFARLEDVIGGWDVAASREAAWISAEALWQIRHESFPRSEYEKRLDDLTTAADELILATI